MKRVSVFASVVFSLSLLVVYGTDHVAQATGQQESMGGSVQDLRSRIIVPEAQVAALQKRIKDLESKCPGRVLTIPGPQIPPGAHLPPGAREHEFNGMKYWAVPLAQGQ